MAEYTAWTEEEDKILINVLESTKNMVLHKRIFKKTAKELDRTWQGVKARMYILRKKMKPLPPQRSQMSEDRDFNYGNYLLENIAQKISDYAINYLLEQGFLGVVEAVFRKSFNEALKEDNERLNTANIELQTIQDSLESEYKMFQEECFRLHEENTKLKKAFRHYEGLKNIIKEIE